ncbi:hypothetical protein D1BOALGB6SA_835 [Olavius sp. associated proteobacterium Delta 1]|nr:hypothetical protein D1BOALGB6SA_835 [Olavius sp. associated proteobacterium Delta 1]
MKFEDLWYSIILLLRFRIKADYFNIHFSWLIKKNRGQI